MKMKQTVALLVVALASFSAHAEQFEDWARVLSSTPRYERINEPRQVCRTERVYEREYEERDERSTSGAVVGGLAGALLGSQVGKGNGRVAAAAVGAATGAIVGDRVQNEGERHPHARRYGRSVERCSNVESWRNELKGYDVTYEYRGRSYATFMPYAPGDQLRLQVSLRPM